MFSYFIVMTALFPVFLASFLLYTIASVLLVPHDYITKDFRKYMVDMVKKYEQAKD